MSEPTTRAGQELLDDPQDGYPEGPGIEPEWRAALAERIRKIEVEAAAEAEARVRELEEALRIARQALDPTRSGLRLSEVIAAYDAADAALGGERESDR